MTWDSPSSRLFKRLFRCLGKQINSEDTDMKHLIQEKRRDVEGAQGIWWREDVGPGADPGSQAPLGAPSVSRSEWGRQAPRSQ